MSKIGQFKKKKRNPQAWSILKQKYDRQQSTTATG